MKTTVSILALMLQLAATALAAPVGTGNPNRFVTESTLMITRLATPEVDNTLIASGAYGTYKRAAEAEPEVDNVLIASGAYGTYKREAEAEAEPEVDNTLIASGAYGTYKREAEAESEVDNTLIASGAYGTY